MFVTNIFTFVPKGAHFLFKLLSAFVISFAVVAGTLVQAHAQDQPIESVHHVTPPIPFSAPLLGPPARASNASSNPSQTAASQTDASQTAASVSQTDVVSPTVLQGTVVSTVRLQSVNAQPETTEPTAAQSTQPATTQPTTTQAAPASSTTAQVAAAQPAAAQPAAAQPAAAQPAAAQPAPAQPAAAQPASAQPAAAQPAAAQPATTQAQPVQPVSNQPAAAQSPVVNAFPPINNRTGRPNESASAIVERLVFNDTSRRVNKLGVANIGENWEFPNVGPHERWMRIDLSEQLVFAYEGTRSIATFVTSTGKASTPTVTGLFRVRMKVSEQTMSGGRGADAYSLPGVKWVMYFHSGYALHGTYWHANFGTPGSHGCVNLTEDSARWLFDWAGPVWDGQTTWFPSTVGNPGSLVLVHQ